MAETFLRSVFRDSKIDLVPGGHPVFPLRWSFRSKLWQFSNSEIAAEAVRRGFVSKISGATVWRRLNEDAIRPWHHRSWIFPRDPNFEIRAGRVLDLYHRQWQGKRLGPREYLLSADEKTSIQARARKHDHCHRARTASCAWSTSTNGRAPGLSGCPGCAL